jgi:CMP-N,N'-diacetyllegionaminic acid synthase
MQTPPPGPPPAAAAAGRPRPPGGPARSTRTCVAIIPARGGSKGIARKNARPFGGVPLIVRAVRGALAARLVTRVVVSTDDEEMLRLAVAAGAEAPFGLRPAALATDTARTVDVLAHVMDWIRDAGEPEPDMLVMLQPTSPLRTAADIDGSIQLLVDSEGCEAVVGVSEAAHHPMKIHKVGADGRLQPFVHNPYGTVNRRELPTAYQENGSTYVQTTASFRANTGHFYCGLRSSKIAPYLMPAESSIDLDSEADWTLGEILLAARPAGE